jgi:hypothetical protein
LWLSRDKAKYDLSETAVALGIGRSNNGF